MKKEKVLIVCSHTDIDLARDYKGYYTIGVERGCLDLIGANLPIDHALGDFDSVNQEEFTLIKSYAKDLVKLPAEKDLLDGEEAIIYAQSLNPEELVFISDGPRLDMTLASLGFVRDYGLILRNSHNYCFMLREGLNTLEAMDEFKYLSFIGLKKSVLDIENLAYEAREISLDTISANAISNEFIQGEKGLVRLIEGQVMAIYSK
ncbi:thiamine diphosphokinase [Streptococcaceae bacterium ESL0687]|nr:thiamine diphosphokinase [Streptococcaceae bacterium ESL0687]